MHKELSAYVGISTSTMLSSLLACSLVDMACKTLLLLSTVWNVLFLIAGDLSAESQTPSDGAELVPSVQHYVTSETALPAASHQSSLKPFSCAATTTANQAAGASAVPSVAPPGLQPSAGHAAAASQPRLQQSSEGASATAPVPLRLQQSLQTAVGAVPARPRQSLLSATPIASAASMPAQPHQSLLPAHTQLASVGASTSATGKMSTAITARQSDPAQKMTGNGAVGKQCSLCQLAIRCI